MSRGGGTFLNQRKTNCDVFSVTDFSTLKSTKSEDYRCFNFLFLFVTSYLTSLSAARRLTLPKNYKKIQKTNKKKTENKQHSFWISGFLVTLLESRRIFFSWLLIYFFFLFTNCSHQN